MNRDDLFEKRKSPVLPSFERYEQKKSAESHAFSTFLMGWDFMLDC